MIVPMKKVSFIVQSKDSNEILKKLRSLGLIHVKFTNNPQGKDINLIKENIALINSALHVLQEALSGEKAACPSEIALNNWKELALHIQGLGKRIEQLNEYAQSLNNEIAKWKVWGDFNPDKVKSLEKKGIYFRFFEVPKNKLNKISSNVIVKQISTNKGFVNCLVISREKKDFGFVELTLPRMGLARTLSRLSQVVSVIEGLKNEAREKTCHYLDLLKVRSSLEKELCFQEAIFGMGMVGDISYLEGFAPVSSSAILEDAAKKNKWGLLISEPSSEDAVPTLLKNPRCVSLISPVLKLLGIVPGYYELDVNLVFFIFFSIFFGILIGDAGYGLVYLLISFWLSKKIGTKLRNKDVFFLFYVLSFCAIIWGLLTGTFFGQSWLQKFGINGIAPVLNDPKTIQTLCFGLGALNLSIAHSWRAILKAPSLAAFSDVGWICILWAAFFLAKTLILADVFPSFCKWLIMVGLFLVIFFTNPQKNIFKTVGEGLGTVALSLMNNFTDVVSYVRLFAVGLAGVAIAETANSMAASLGTGFVAIIAGVLITVIGHSLNIILGPMSVLVHGVRLNVLEFSGHASITWSGVAYKPLEE